MAATLLLDCARWTDVKRDKYDPLHRVGRARTQSLSWRKKPIDEFAKRRPRFAARPQDRQLLRS
jgi:hypothetical protein